jgi:hypothetical protein
MTSGLEARGRFGKQDFVYLSDEDAYRCPAGEKLTCQYTSDEATALLDQCVPRLCTQSWLYDWQGAADCALGA